MTALVIAMVMVLGTMNMAGAANGVNPGDLNWNSTLTVSGLDEGDTVTYYHIIDWDLEHTINETDAANSTPIGWAWANGVTFNDDTTTAANKALLRKIVGTADGAGQIDSTDAATLANALGTAKGENMALTSTGEWSVQNQDPGLYMVIVTPGKPGTMYNPIFVAANFYGNNETPDESYSIAVSADKPTYYNKGMAKKSTIPLNKTATGSDEPVNLTNENDQATDNSAHTTDIGEEITYTVTTTIPRFGDNYDAPVFKLHDTLTGLKISAAPKVFAAETASYTDTDNLLSGSNTVTYASALTDGAYILTDGAVDDDEYTIQFTEAYLRQVGAAGQKITIVYKAVVTDEAAYTVNQENNTVDLNFSTKPDDTTGYGLLENETNHFTFSIDANLFGSKYGSESSTEAIKIGVDKDGEPIVSMKSYAWNNEVEHAALEGATFTLYIDSDDDGKPDTPYKDGNNQGRTAVSDSTGRITIKGLDAGNYWLKEDTAPTGYIALQDYVPVVISAKINENKEVTVSYTADGKQITTTHVTNELVSYSVTIGGSTTSYTMENSADGTTMSVSRSIDSSDKELANTKGVELPSTGGMGTTLFYAIGAILVLGAGILLVSKRRMSAN